MDRTLLLTGAMIALLFIPIIASAQEAVTAGVTPDSWLYFFDTVLDNLAVKLIPGTEHKIDRLLEIAEERLAETEAMAAEDNINAMNKAEVQHRDALSRADKYFSEFIIEGSPDTIDIQNSLQQRIKDHETQGEKTKLAIQIKLTQKDSPDQPAQEVNQTTGEIITNNPTQPQEVSIAQRNAGIARRNSMENWEKARKLAGNYHLLEPDNKTFYNLISYGDQSVKENDYEEAELLFSKAYDYTKKAIEALEQEAKDKGLMDEFTENQQKNSPDYLRQKAAQSARIDAVNGWERALKVATDNNLTLPDDTDYVNLIREGDEAFSDKRYVESESIFSDAESLAKKVEFDLTNRAKENAEVKDAREDSESAKELALERWEDLEDLADAEDVPVPSKTLFNEFIEKGDDSFDGKEYDEAEDYYRDARNYASSKIEDIMND